MINKQHFHQLLFPFLDLLNTPFMERLNKAILLGDLLFLEQKGRNPLKPEGLGIAVSGLEYTLFHKYKMDYLLKP